MCLIRLVRTDTTPGLSFWPSAVVLCSALGSLLICVHRIPERRGLSVWAPLRSPVCCPVNSVHAGLPDSQLHPDFPRFSFLVLQPGNSLKKISWDNCKAYFACFLFLGITFLCHLISSILEIIISCFLFLCVHKFSTLLFYLGWKSKWHIWINFCELFWILKAED